MRRAELSAPILVLAGATALIAYCLWHVTHPPRPSAAEMLFLRPYGLVVDTDRKPLTGVTIRFRDTMDGRLLASFVTNAHGAFVWEGLEEQPWRYSRHIRADGYVVVEMHLSSGGPTEYIFCRLGRCTAIFSDERGRPLMDWPVEMSGQPYLSPRQRYWFRGRTDARGRILLQGCPVAARQVGFVSKDERRVVSGVKREAAQGGVVYHVVTLPGATIAGRVLLADGRPARGFLILCHRAGAAWDERRLAWVGPTGRFRLVGLRPGAYIVGARRRYEFRVLAGRAVRVVAGENKPGVELRLPTRNASPFRPE